jgi:hypothetical protein
VAKRNGGCIDLEVEVVGDVDAVGEHQLELNLQEAHTIAGLELALLDSSV